MDGGTLPSRTAIDGDLRPVLRPFLGLLPLLSVTGVTGILRGARLGGIKTGSVFLTSAVAMSGNWKHDEIPCAFSEHLL